MIFENSSGRTEETMNLDEFLAKLDELLGDAEIHIPWPQLVEVLRDKTDALEEVHEE